MSELTAPVATDGVRTRRLGFPPAAVPPTGVRRVAHLLIGLVASPFYWLLGAIAGVPGMAFRARCFGAGVRLLFAGHLADAYHCMVSPLDSVRHFEMAFFWRRVRRERPSRMLDVSSPRLLTLLALRADPAAQADMLNPDTNDLARTRSMAHGLGVAARCRFLEFRIDALPPDSVGYPLVTCMSVLEHIVEDMVAVRAMWARVAPGGRLLLSVPCAAQGLEEFSNVDEYGLLDADDAGFVFWQRYYDQSRLDAIFAITGRPVAQAIYAERVPGAYDADVLEKRTNPLYPRWREPWATARTYVARDNVGTLSGMGVIALEFAKPTAAV